MSFVRGVTNGIRVGPLTQYDLVQGRTKWKLCRAARMSFVRGVTRGNKHAEYYPQMESIITIRRIKMTYVIHCLGFALTPIFYDSHYLETIAPEGIAKRAPNQDKEVNTTVMQAFENIAENGNKQKLLRDQFSIFHTKKGMYSLLVAQMDALTMDFIDWWSTFGLKAP
ncbi:hypothetical protein Fmac_028850 [Flemingia macrophylla]|uniref:Uncharacterized protein n=1 Tax=Flemingia macrophylla TaxID=520843 RepID=A0ABD1L8S8_9FABA